MAFRGEKKLFSSQLPCISVIRNVFSVRTLDVLFVSLVYILCSKLSAVTVWLIESILRPPDC